ncbi:carboxymuconolactone decarboxylase family protein [Oceanobacillus sp. CF4.6]|uniref:carboxymuconolactone decarboxylase family protein n=1 Tax=Oceanobacillus sp. CF4.6 TaxID=3373080 RepID=UPI003EE75A2F
MSYDGLYNKSYFNRLGELSDLAPEVFKAFAQFDKLALSEGKLTKKLKELIAIAIVHTIGCPYCIEVHVKYGKSQDISKEEMSEAILVATALKAGSALAHGVNALNAYDGNGDEDLYKASYFSRLNEFSKLNGDIFSSFVDFDQKSMKEGALSVKERELIAIAIVHTTGCPYCIDVHTKGQSMRMQLNKRFQNLLWSQQI